MYFRGSTYLVNNESNRARKNTSSLSLHGSIFAKRKNMIFDQGVRCILWNWRFSHIYSYFNAVINEAWISHYVSGSSFPISFCTFPKCRWIIIFSVRLTHSEYNSNETKKRYFRIDKNSSAPIRLTNKRGFKACRIFFRILSCSIIRKSLKANTFTNAKMYVVNPIPFCREQRLR